MTVSSWCAAATSGCSAAIGEPDERVKLKLRTEIDETARKFIERSPFIVVSTSDADGRLDASPKGDPPGFVHVIDSTTLAIPERKGNALGFGQDSARPALFGRSGSSPTL